MSKFVKRTVINLSFKSNSFLDLLDSNLVDWTRSPWTRLLRNQLKWTRSSKTCPNSIKLGMSDWTRDCPDSIYVNSVFLDSNFLEFLFSRDLSEKVVCEKKVSCLNNGKMNATLVECVRKDSLLLSSPEKLKVQLFNSNFRKFCLSLQ